MQIAYSAFVAILLFCGAAHAAEPDTLSVVQHEFAAYKSANLEAILTHYTPASVVLTPSGWLSPTGVFSGKDAVRRMFTILTDKTHSASNDKLEVRFEQVAPDMVLLHWNVKDAPEPTSGHDVFVVRGGKIVFQAVYPDPKK